MHGEGNDVLAVGGSADGLVVAAQGDALVEQSLPGPAYGLNGVGYRGIGMLRDQGIRPPAQWWKLEDVWTWRRVCSTYLFRQQAWLKVKNRKLSGLEGGNA